MNTETIASSQSPAQALANAATHAKTLAGDALQTVTQAFEQGRSSAAAQLNAGREAVVDHVRKRPLTTIGAAALIGVLFGVLLFRR